jgi:hypothetical protein
MNERKIINKGVAVPHHFARFSAFGNFNFNSNNALSNCLFRKSGCAKIENFASLFALA